MSKRIFVPRRTFWLLFLLLCAAISCVAQQPQSRAGAPVMAIRTGKLVDVETGRLLTNQVILVRGGKIEATGENLPIPAEATVIDLSKMTVLPGLIDCHTHLADGARDTDPISQLKKTAAQVALESVPNARVTLESGFTTVRDVGVYRALGDIALRDATARGYVVCPRMFVAGGYITISRRGGRMTRLPPRIHLPFGFDTTEEQTPRDGHHTQH